MLQQKLEELFALALDKSGLSGQFRYKIEVAPRPELGDYACNLAIIAAKKLARNPLEIAQLLAAKLIEVDQCKILDKVEVASPGFINLFFTQDFLSQGLNEAIKADQSWGRSSPQKSAKILLEFVSANPTGPLHVGHGRWAVVGDVLTRLLQAAGHQVAKEFYVNNVGNQVEKLWQSVVAVRKGEPVPEGGYGGVYIKDVQGDSLPKVLAVLLQEQKETLQKIGVNFDRFYFESELQQNNLVSQAIDELSKRGKTFQEEGALWFRSQEYGDDKNRVLVRADGQPTYFASDIAYHLEKFKRGFGRLINIWGTDHHGYLKRLQAAMQALGQPAQNLEIIIGQLVALYRGKELIRMSKRTGEMITLQEVVEDIGSDAVRFFFAATDVNSHLDFDLELAKKQSNDNPVYYVQYAHARICSIFRKAAGATPLTGQPKEPISQAERQLMLKLLAYPDVIRIAAELRQPHRLTEYAKEIANTFHHFYEKCRVLGNPDRLRLVDASRITLRNVLELLGISAPEAM